ncbi:hypothetical protein EASAB2608_01009 [Streptomyces sp. EAS-AB2608]|uniref:hypothetical protein n=1 Tax=Streptomyces sp. EAS-AB2608 TaxID=2779671 RepID=UPI001BEF8E45|nr:hypothetical protein [Streptomyces sp. EAS-AB2608]BCM65675.1 hypothetical protein EASAB2608_01009 [Streptomyces sp. EAS-AB2608]
MTTIRKVLVAGRPLPAHQAANAPPTPAQWIALPLDSVRTVQRRGELDGCRDSWWGLTETPAVTTCRQARLSSDHFSVVAHVRTRAVLGICL